MQAGELPRPGAPAEEYVEAFLAYKLAKQPCEHRDSNVRFSRLSTWPLTAQRRKSRFPHELPVGNAAPTVVVQRVHPDSRKLPFVHGAAHRPPN
jgi:hypothetical protein